MYRIDDRVPNTTRGNGVYDFTGFRAIPSLALAIVRSTGEILITDLDVERVVAIFVFNKWLGCLILEFTLVLLVNVFIQRRVKNQREMKKENVGTQP